MGSAPGSRSRPAPSVSTVTPLKPTGCAMSRPKSLAIVRHHSNTGSMFRVLSLHVWVPLLLVYILTRPPEVRERWFGPAPDVTPTEARWLAAAFSPPVAGVGGPPPFARFGARNPFLTRHIACFDRPWNELRHAGDDWFRSAGSE